MLQFLGAQKKSPQEIETAIKAFNLLKWLYLLIGLIALPHVRACSQQNDSVKIVTNNRGEINSLFTADVAVNARSTSVQVIVLLHPNRLYARQNWFYYPNSLLLPLVIFLLRKSP